MKTAKLFRNGESQAVRLPKEFRMTGSAVFIKKLGNATILIPIDNPWDSLFKSISKFSADFMDDRPLPKQQDREPI